MEITEEQKRRAEANRLAALEKRSRAAAGLISDHPWRLAKCPKMPTLAPPPPPTRGFRALLQICSPDEFSVSPEPLEGLPYPGDPECFRIIEDCFSSVVPFHFNESQTGKRMFVYKVEDYNLVARCLRKLKGVQLQEIPFYTHRAVEKLSQCVGNHWVPCEPEHLSDDRVDELMRRIPKFLLDALLPFQLEGIRFGLRRGGRCLIADEMGLGKTIQAIGIACCFMNEGPVLVICPAVLRFSWAEEFEHWLPVLLPKDIHLIFGHQDNLDHLGRDPKVVVISYAMLSRLRKSMLERHWAVMIVDESHNLRCTKKRSESEETRAVLDVARKSNHVILLSGTPSLSMLYIDDFSTCDHRPYDIYHQVNIVWPGLLGKDKYEFANNYCAVKLVQVGEGKVFMDFSKGIRLEELNILLRQTLMIRRLKEYVMAQLPPKRRQIIKLLLSASDIHLAVNSCRDSVDICLNKEHKNEILLNHCSNQREPSGDEKSESCKGSYDEHDYKKSPRKLSYQEIGIAKLSGFCQWLSNHAVIREADDATSLDSMLMSQKMIIFAHHLKVLDKVQEFVSEKGIKFVRIDGSTLAKDRQAAVEDFQQSMEVKIAIIGITAGGVGLDFSSARNVVFLELPKSASEMLQAEDRAHRRGQTNAVNIYIFCAKGTSDESHWVHLNKSLFRVSSVMNGKYKAIKEIEVDDVFHLQCYNSSKHARPEGTSAGDLEIGMEFLTNDSSSVQNLLNCKLYQLSQKLDLIESSNSEDECRLQGIKCSLKDVLHTDKENVAHVEADKLSDSHVEGSCGYMRCGDSENIQWRKFHTFSGSTVDDDDVKNDMLENVKNEADNMCSLKAADIDGRARALVELDSNSPIQADKLRFEVSQYTGRVHLYVCIPGKDSRPRPLSENFRPEELELMALSLGTTKKEITLQHLEENPSCGNIFQAFIQEWNDLRPIERNKLHGKPLQLPLKLELCYLKETRDHGCEGLLKGGSKRRVTPSSDISHPLPQNADWKKISLRNGHGKVKEYTQAWTVSDEPLCKLCQAPCNGKLAKAPEFFEDLFCNLSCFQEYRIRTSQRALRDALFQIERGVCANCKLDCHKLVKCIRPLSIPRRHEYIEKVAPHLAYKKKLLEKLVNQPNEGNAWHADHIIPVYNGGGECRLENMRTLCVACHSEVTAAQQAERRLTRLRAKKQLKKTMKKLSSKVEPASSVADESRLLEVGMGTAEEDLFVKVPGSTYSIKEDEVCGRQDHGKQFV